MGQRATGWLATAMVMTVGLAAMGEAQAQGMEFFPSERSSSAASDESHAGDDEGAFRDALSGLRARSGERSQETGGTSAASVEGGPENSLSRAEPVPQGRAMEPAMQPVMSASSLNPWEVCGELIMVRHDGMGTVLDARGERLGQIDSPNWSSCRDGRLSVGSDAHHLSSFDEARGDWEHARLRMPRDVAISDVQVQEVENSRERGGAFLVDVRTGTEARFLGIWSPGQRDVELEQTPFGGINQARDLGDRLRVAWVDYDENRAGVHYLSDLSSRGVDTVHRQVRGRITILDEGWAVTRSGNSGQVVSPQGDVRDWEIEGCEGRATVWRTMARPAAAIMSCDGDQDGVERFKHWQPRGSEQWSTRRHYQRSSTQGDILMDSDRSVASEMGVDRSTPAGMWFDLDRGTMWRGEPLTAAYRWNGEGLQRSFMATDVALGEEGSSGERALYRIDVDRGTEQPVAVYDDCPGALIVADERGDAAIIHCVSQDAGGAHRFAYHWSEFIDLDSGDWWRTSEMDIRQFGPQGRLIVTDRGAGTDYQWDMGSRLYVTEPVIQRGW